MDVNKDELPVLLHFEISHFNEKARWALDYKGLPHRREALIPGLHLPRVRRVSGQNQVPVLLLGEKVIIGSNHILEEIERLQPDPPLFPPDAKDRQRAMDIQTYFDNEVAPEVRRLFWECYVPHPQLAARMACKGEGRARRLLWLGLFPVLLPVFSKNLGLDKQSLATAKRRLSGHFDWLEAQINPDGYLIGNHFTLADLCAAAVMTAIIRPPEFPYPLAQPWPDELHALRDSLSHRPGFQWVLEIYTRHRCASAETVA